MKEAGQGSLIQTVIMCKVQTSLGFMVDPKNFFCLKWKDDVRLYARSSAVLQGTRKSRGEESFKRKKRRV